MAFVLTKKVGEQQTKGTRGLACNGYFELAIGKATMVFSDDWTMRALQGVHSV